MKNKRRTIICAFIGLIGVLFIAIIVSGVMLKKTNNDVSVIENKEYSNLDYSFSLNDGSIYTKQDGVSFASGLVNTINIKFDYYTNYDDYKDYSIDTDVILYVKPGSINEVNNSRYAAIKVENIENEKNVELGMNQVNLELDYQYYATQLRNYINDNNYTNNSIGRLEVVLKAVNEKKNIINSSSVNISLLEESVDISLNRSINNTSFLQFGNNTGTYKLLILGLIFLLSITCAIFYFYLKLSKMSVYERSLYKIFKLYRNILVDSDVSKINVDNLIEVTSFKELLKVQNNISLPIMYNKKDTEVRFIIKSSNGGYYYDLLDDKKNQWHDEI